MNIILGLSASGGTGVGKAFVLPETQERIIPKRQIDSQLAEDEWSRFSDACSSVQVRIESHLNTLPKDNLQRVIYETYLLMLGDPVFLQEVKDCLNSEFLNIEYVLERKTVEYADKLRKSGNDYLAERAKDIEDVFGQVQDVLLNYNPFDIEKVPDDVVVVAKELRPCDAFILNKRRILGLALAEGGVSSHIAILARSFGIPAVVSLDKITDNVENGELVVVDGDLGEVIINPDEASINDCNEKIEKARRYRETLAQYRDKKAQTKDGTTFNIFANIGTPEEAKSALEEGADGIGLFRTEFLFMNSLTQDSSVPGSAGVSEEKQFEAYKYVLETMGDRPVTIRTLDAGGDKVVDLKSAHEKDEKNPLMGLRAIRLSLFHPQVFRIQLRALYRASIYGNLRIMVPLVTDVAQVDTVMGIAKGVRLSLKEEGIPFKEVPIGIMVETAAAAITSDCLAKKVGFFSVGTNDLTQYTLGVDRENPAVAPYYNEFSLAVVRLLNFIIHNARKYEIPLSVCGEMAGKKESAMILAGMGVRNLSMAPKQIPEIKETLSHFSIEELRCIANNRTVE